VPDLLRAASDGSLTDRTYWRIKRDIIELRYAPGQALKEKEVAQVLASSKTPVREAFARLVSDGLLLPLGRQGYGIAPVTLSDASELCDMRTLLQSEAAGRAAERGLSPGDAARLRELCVDVAGGPLGGPGMDARLHGNFEFEALIANASGNGRLALAVVRMLDEFERVVRLALLLDPALPPWRLSERQRIVDGILSGSAAAAESAMRSRAKSAKTEILRALRASAAVREAEITVPLG